MAFEPSQPIVITGAQPGSAFAETQSAVNQIISIANELQYPISTHVAALNSAIKMKDTKAFRSAYQDIQRIAPKISEQYNKTIDEENRREENALTQYSQLYGRVSALQQQGVQLSPDVIGALDQSQQQFVQRDAERQANPNARPKTPLPSPYIAQQLRAEIDTIASPPPVAKTGEKPSQQTAADTAFEQNIAAALRYTKQLEDTVKEHGTFEVYDPKGSAILGQLPYQMAIAYAKIVDPSSVAREGEVTAAQKYLIPTGFFTRNETALAAIRNFRDDLQERAKQYSRSKGKEIVVSADVIENQDVGTDATQNDQPRVEEGQYYEANRFFQGRTSYKSQPANR